MHGKSCKDKGECDLYNKKVKNKKDNIFCDRDCKCQNIRGLIFIFEKKDLDSESIKDLEVWARNGTSWDRDNFILLIY